MLLVLLLMFSETIQASSSVSTSLFIGVQGIEDHAVITFVVARPGTPSGLTFLTRNEFIHKNVLRRNAKMFVAFIIQCALCTAVHIFFPIMTI